MDSSPAEHALIISLALGEGASAEAVFALGEELEAAVDSAGAGEFDGDEIGAEDAKFYLYGPDADRLLSAVQPVLERLQAAPGSYVTKRYGPPGSSEEQIALLLPEF